MAATPIPLAPASEQKRITQAVSRLLSIQASAGSAMTDAGRRASRLRQSILKWAIEGKLVDQDPTDEPASALLARIRAERPDGPKKQRGRRRASSP